MVKTVTSAQFDCIPHKTAVTPAALLALLVWSFVGSQSQAASQATATAQALGAVSIRIAGAHPELPLTVYVDSSRAGTSNRLAPGDEPTLTKGGLQFDTYYVSATQDDDLVTEIKAVRLDDLHPAAFVELEISENRSALILSDPSGSPVRKASIKPVRPGDPRFLQSGLHVPETEPGRYPLTGVRPGTSLLIRQNGFVPMCRVVPLNEPVFAMLERGRQIEVQFPRDITIAVVAELAALSGVPESDCPVPLSAFRPEAVTSAVAELLLFRIDHFDVQAAHDKSSCRIVVV